MFVARCCHNGYSVILHTIGRCPGRFQDQNRRVDETTPLLLATDFLITEKDLRPPYQKPPAISCSGPVSAAVFGIA